MSSFLDDLLGDLPAKPSANGAGMTGATAAVAPVIPDFEIEVSAPEVEAAAAETAVVPPKSSGIELVDAAPALAAGQGTGLKGFWVVFGVPGTGKSTAVLETFQDSIMLASATNAAHYYKTVVMPKDPARYRMPRKLITIEPYAIDGKARFVLDAKGKPTGALQTYSAKDMLEYYVDRVMSDGFSAWSRGEPTKYKNLIIDEAGTFWSRVFKESFWKHPDTFAEKTGKHDPRRAYGMVGDWSSTFVDKLRPLTMIGMNVVLVCHDQEPDRAEDKKGGPKFPSQPIMKQIAADADCTVLRALEDNMEDASLPSERVWVCFGKQNWVTKVRGLADTDYAKIKNWPLDKIARAASFEP